MKKLLTLMLTISLTAALALTACGNKAGEGANGAGSVGTTDVTPDADAADADAAGADAATPEAAASQTPEETPSYPEGDRDPYSEIIAQYAEAEANNFYQDVDSAERDSRFGELIATEWRANPAPASYALVDIDNNGTDELLIATLDTKGGYSIYGLFANENGEAVSVFDMDLGYRVNLDVYADGELSVTWSNSAFESGRDIYKLDGSKAALVSSYVTKSEESAPETLKYLINGEEKTEDEYNAAIAELDAKLTLSPEWVKIAVA